MGISPLFIPLVLGSSCISSIRGNYIFYLITMNTELIKLCEDVVAYIENNLRDNTLFLCTMFLELEIKGDTSTYLEYLKLLEENKPTPTLHKEFYDSPYYIKAPKNIWWSPLVQGVGLSKNVSNMNKQKILFLKHLILTIKTKKES